jgi:hypothetical protein
VLLIKIFPTIRKVSINFHIFLILSEKLEPKGNALPTKTGDGQYKSKPVPKDSPVTSDDASVIQDDPEPNVIGAFRGFILSSLVTRFLYFEHLWK